MSDRTTPNLPSRDFVRTEAFYARLGFTCRFRDTGWMILARGDLVVEFFPHPEVDPKSSWFSACIRVDDLDGLYDAFRAAGLPGDPRALPRLTAPEARPPVPRMFALVDLDGSPWRCLENEAA
jgi:hypothetical protein